MKKRKLNKVKFDMNQIIDVAGASLIVQYIPKLLSNFGLAIPSSFQAVAGAGAGYLAGSIFNRSNLANASIALGLLTFVNPIVDNTMTVVTGSGTIPAGSSGAALPGSSTPVKSLSPITTVDDYISLNDYIVDPSVKQSFFDYQQSY